MRARASFARLGALVLVASTTLGGAACGLVAGLDKLSFHDPAACAAKCAQDAERDDHNACTTDACDRLESRCRSTPLADGTQTPGAVSMPGNCRTHRCLAGVDVDAVDDLDRGTPTNDCVTAMGANGALSLPPKALGTAGMTSGGQVCDGAGAGVACKVAGSIGVCTNIPSGQTDFIAAVTCLAPNACNGVGACKKTTGQTCGAASECVSGSCADGVCCNTACTGTCTACNVAGAVGTCSNSASGQPDTNATLACTGVDLCDGMGVCKLGPGQPCMLGSDCFSTFCTSNVCQ